MTITTETPGLVTANGLDIYVEQVGQGPDVLLIGGLGDTVESWQFQLDGLSDRYRMTAFDNRGAGRTAMPDAPSPWRRWPTTPPACCGRSTSRPPSRRLLRRQPHRPGAGAPASAARA